MKYLDLMGGQKPHLMTRMINNLGAETEVEYSPSTKFYLRDKAAGTPWATNCPSRCTVSRTITVRDTRRARPNSRPPIAITTATSTVSNAIPGLRRVEHVDTQRFDDFADANAAQPLCHAGPQAFSAAGQDRSPGFTPASRSIVHRILGLFEQRVLSGALMRTGSPPRSSPNANCRNPQSKTDDGTPALGTDEWREAIRACKGMALRQENSYELDIDALHSRNEHR